MSREQWQSICQTKFIQRNMQFVLQKMTFILTFFIIKNNNSNIQKDYLNIYELKFHICMFCFDLVFFLLILNYLPMLVDFVLMQSNYRGDNWRTKCLRTKKLFIDAFFLQRLLPSRPPCAGAPNSLIAHLISSL